MKLKDFLPLDARGFLSRGLFKFVFFQTHNNDRPHIRKGQKHITREGKTQTEKECKVLIWTEVMGLLWSEAVVAGSLAPVTKRTKRDSSNSGSRVGLLREASVWGSPLG